MTGRPLAGTVALVAGAAGSVGECTAMALAQQGCAVSLLAEHAEQLEVPVKEITSAGGTAIATCCDVTDYTAAEQAVCRTVAELGRLDVLVNNAGVARFGELEDVQVAEWQRMLQVNLAGAFHLIGAAVPHLLDAAGGPAGVADVVSIGSTASNRAPGGAVHQATQDGVRTFTRELRRELSSRHVRVGLVESDLVDPRISDRSGEPQPPVQPPDPEWTPLLRPEDVADAVRYMVTRSPRLAATELRLDRV